MEIDLKKLPEVNLKAKCTKCGYQSISAEYITFNKILRGDNGKFVMVKTWLNDDKEAIKRTCNNCGYEWLESCLK